MWTAPSVIMSCALFLIPWSKVKFNQSDTSQTLDILEYLFSHPLYRNLTLIMKCK